MTTTIYALIDARDGVVRYIGQTKAPLSARLRGHLQAARRQSTPLHAWVADAHQAGALSIRALKQTDRPDVEERVAIREHSRSGLLLNVRHGGRRAPPSKNLILARPVMVAPDDNGTLLITCPSLPEVTTFAASPKDIVRRANDAIEEALYARSASA